MFQVGKLVDGFDTRDKLKWFKKFTTVSFFKEKPMKKSRWYYYCATVTFELTNG